MMIPKIRQVRNLRVLDLKNFIGFAPIQTEEFVQQEIKLVLENTPT